MAKKSERPQNHGNREVSRAPQTPGVPEQTTDLNTLVPSLIRRMDTWRQACQASQSQWDSNYNRGSVGVFKTSDGGLIVKPFSETLRLNQPDYLYTIAYEFGFGMGKLEIHSVQANTLADPENGERIVGLKAQLGGGSSTDPFGTRTLTVSETYSSSSMALTHEGVVYKTLPPGLNWTVERGEPTKLQSVREEEMTDKKAQQLFDMVDSILLRGNPGLPAPKNDEEV